MPSTSNDAGEDEVMLEQHEGAEGSGGPEAQLVITAIKQLSILAEQQLLNSRDFKLSPDTLNCIRQLTDNLSHLKIMEKPTGELQLPQQPVDTEQISGSSSCMNSPQPIPGLLTPSELSKKRPGLAEPIPLDKRVKRAEEPKPTPQAPKSDAERFAELEGELFGPEPPTEPRASELSKQMFEHLGKEPPAEVMVKMRNIYLDKGSLHRRMVDKGASPKWCSYPYISWMDSLKTAEEREFEDFTRALHSGTTEIEAGVARIRSMSPQPDPVLEQARNTWNTVPVTMSEPCFLPRSRLEKLLLYKPYDIDVAAAFAQMDRAQTNTNEEDG